MNNIIKAISILVISGCSHQSALEPPAMQVDLKSIELPESTIYVADVNIMEHLLPEVEMTIRDAPFEPAYMRCGGVYSDEMQVREILESAEIIFRLQGVSEAWTPIEGKPKQYFVFKVQ